MTHEPIAIVGIGCRFPGASDAESFWRVLRDGIETVGEYPGNRFRYIDRAFSADAVKRGNIATRRGGFLPDLEKFDAEFFGISPREAALLDPQQRLMLEVAYEAAEDAGIPLSKLYGSRTGVFVGLWNSDYERCIFDLSHDLDFYTTTGGGRYPASGRLAYFLDLRGPNLTVDTACSSSLVAIHLACASLHDGESEMALAGGVNVILRPEITLSYSSAKMLSPEGRCKFGDAAADGYVRSEGAGIVFLKTLTRAVSDGDSIYAVIRGSAVNNDGRSSGSLIAPSREGQEGMLRTALRDAGVAPHEVAYIEAHGTGTLAGDPVEIAAIRSVVATESRTEPCLVGSVKTNLGHTESAAGAAGLIKVALSLQHGTIPASLHFREPNPRIDWNAVAVPIAATPWPARGAEPIGGVSGFGITGTNAHVVLQGAPSVVTKHDNRGSSHIFLLSAQTPAALEARAASWRDRLLADSEWPATFADLAYTASVRRTHHDHRLALVAASRAELLDRINAWIAKQEQSGARSGKRLPEENRRAVFVLPGQGGQWFGMGRTLLRDEPVFRKALAQCDEAIQKFTGWSVTDRLTQADAETALAGIDVIQPVLFAVMVSLAELWRSFGVDPQAVVGHSMGEAAAAAVCGALSLEDAAAVICHRSRLMKQASGRGLMAVAELSLDDARKFVLEYAGRISVAANNSPTSTVLSGDADAIEDALAKLEAREIFCRRIKVDVASHSAHMEPFREELARLLKDIQPRKNLIPFYSTTTGVVEDGTALGANYWTRNLRQPVLFSAAVQSLLADGFDTFVEVNSHPVLLQAIEDGIRHAQRDAVAVHSLRRDKDERSEMLDALGALYTSGFPVDFARLYPAGNCLRLPTYPWQRERYWIEEDDALTSRGQGTSVHPNLGAHIASSVQPGAHLWEVNLRPASDADDAAASLLVALAMAAASEAFGPGPIRFEDLEFFASSVKDLAGQLVIAPVAYGRWSLRISARTDSGWSLRCTGAIRSGREEFIKLPAGEFRERLLEDHEREPVRECFKLAAELIEERERSGSVRISKIGRIVCHDFTVQGKRVARTRLSGEPGNLQAEGRLELQDCAVLAEFAGVQFEPVAETDSFGCTYQLNWVATENPSSSNTKKSWILNAESGPLADRIVQKLKSAGDDCVLVPSATEALRALESSWRNCDGVIHLSCDAGTDPGNHPRETSKIVELAQALASARRDSQPPRLFLLTTGAWHLAGDGGDVAAAQGPAWGLGRVISAEHPEWRCVNVDLSGSPSAEELDSLNAWLRAETAEEQISIRGAASFVARLERNVAAASSGPLRLSPDATYLITGGLGGVGLNLARWMVARGARSIALLGRSAPSESARAEIKNLEFSGSAVRIFNSDVADENQMSTVLCSIAQDMPPLRGVFHLAAAMDSTLLADVNAEQIERAMRAKAEGAWVLHHLTQDLPLGHFVLFSSMTASIGQPGVASYAAANSALDALARFRHNKGLKAISIQWGPWANLGLTKTDKARRGVDMYAQQGIRSLSFDETFDSLSQLLQQDIAGALVAPIQWKKFASSFAGDSVPRTFLSLIPNAENAADAAATQTSVRENLLAALPGRSRRALLEGHLQEVLAGVLKTSASRLDPVRPLGSMGVDSLMALQFVKRLALTTSVRLPATAVFNYPTLRVLAAELARRLEINLDADVQASAAPQISETLAGVSAALAELTEDETIQALLQGGGRLMSDRPEKVLSAAKLALAIKQLRAETSGFSLLGSEPVAIVGIGCRFPGGANSAAEYWQLLHDGVDAISTIPTDRWDADAYFDLDPQAPEKMNGRWGGFVAGADLFDPVFFGISPREATSIDPQQRLVLEVSWEAMWDSGRAPGSLSGSRTGVFMALCGSDYERMLFDDAALIGPQSCSGAYHSIASGRVSFLLNLRGPSISVDTACSSSLVAVHLACQSLRAGDCKLALAGGVTLHLRPEHYIGLSKLGMLSPDGRCKAFDSRANGFVPSEGCGVVVLKLLADALRDGDRVYAVVRGTAVNQDGRTNVLTAPNGLAQQEVVRAALHNAQVQPWNISYVETHGTGTALGDPIEVEALTEVLGASSLTDVPCALGAAKSNVGHLEAAAGIAGLIKAALALDRQEIPGNLHYEELNPHISLQGTRFYIPTQPQPWMRGSAGRFAGISSFGFGGTNAHVVLEEAPQFSQRAPKSDAAHSNKFILPISARTLAALKEFARLYLNFLGDENRASIDLYDVCHSAATRRDHYEERLTIVGGAREDLRKNLENFLAGQSKSEISSGRASVDGERVAFVFSGQGSQWPRMGAEMFEREPVFRAAIEECNELVKEFAGWSLIDHLLSAEDVSKLQHTEYAQPAIFAVEMALARLWMSWGVAPQVIIGHSAGEIAAACASGFLGLREAVRVVVLRGRLMESATGFGKMATIHLPASAVAERIQSFGDDISIAAINSPKSTVIAGTSAAVERLTAEWMDKGVGCRMLPVDYAFHGAQMQPYSEELTKALGTVATQPQKIPVISTVRGAKISDGDGFDATYWGQNIRRPVLFAQAVQVALEMGARTFLEIGPHPVLLSSVGECSANGVQPETLLPSLRRGKDELGTMLSSLAKLYVLGAPVEWSSVYTKPAPPATLPVYPFQRQRFWIDERPKAKVNASRDLCGERLQSPSLRGSVFESQLSVANFPFLADHRIEGSLLVPMTAFLELANAAVLKSGLLRKALVDLSVLSPLELPAEDSCTVQTIVEDDTVRIFSLSHDQWKLHASCRLVDFSATASQVASPSSLAAGLDLVMPRQFYERLREHNVQFGPSFQLIDSLHTRPGKSVARIRLAEREKCDAARFRVHPALLDGCLQAAIAAAPENFVGAYLPFSLDRLETYDAAGADVWAIARVSSSSTTADTLTADIDVADVNGKLLVRIGGLHFKRRTSSANSNRAIYQVQWQRSESTEPPNHSGRDNGSWLIIADEDAEGRKLAARMQEKGLQVFALKTGAPLDAQKNLQGVVRLIDSREVKNPFDAQAKICGSVLSLAQEMLKRFPANSPRLLLVTQGAMDVVPGDRSNGCAAATVWGLGRTIGMEHPELHCVSVDLDPAAADYESLALEMTYAGGEEEIALRGGERYVPRVEPKFIEDPQPRRLVIPSRGSIDNLAVESIERRAPVQGEVEVEVEASALNFRDVLNVLGMYPGDPGPLGLEFCGRIARLGERVEGFRVGERVMGLSWASFSSFVTTPAALVVKVPATLNPVPAATIPNAFLTAHHCLIELGCLQSGQRVLVHAATGGVGLAAVQIAMQAGAEIFATAGSEQKREYLRSLGVQHVFSSRKPGFASEIRARTGGKGVDLVLNSLAGDFIQEGFDILAKGGRFIEIGKTGIWGDERVAALGKSIHYHVVDLGIVMREEPERIQPQLLKIASAIQSGSLQPLPSHVFDFEDAAPAFRFMAQAKHIGKIVLRHPGPLRISADATYLVTGGLGALGLHVARWLVEHGTRNLLLLGRSSPSPEASKIISELRGAGIRVEIRAVDVSNRAQLETVLEEARTAMPPLRGIVHAAGVLDDGVLTQQTWNRYEQVMAPKISGAWNLHELTSQAPLDFFLLFSSMASLTGSPGQSGYAASNAFLDAFAGYRKARGLAALSINWGAWPDGGMAAKVETQGRRRVLPAIRPMPEQDCLDCLTLAIAQNCAQLAIADVDWSKWENPTRLLSSVVRHAPIPAAVSEQEGILERLSNAPASNRRKVLLEYLREEALDVLGLGKAHFIDERQPLVRMGLDSLMAVEFRNRLVASLKRPLTATLLFDYPNLGRLADYLEEREATQPTVPPEMKDSYAETLDSLTDAQAEELLKEELGQSS